MGRPDGQLPMKPDIYLAATSATLHDHSLIQVGFICASLLLSGGWTEPDKVYVPAGHGYAICDISTAPKAVKVDAAKTESLVDIGDGESA